MFPKNRNIAFKLRNEKEFLFIRNFLINNHNINFLEFDSLDIKNSEIEWLYLSANNIVSGDLGLITLNVMSSGVTYFYRPIKPKEDYKDKNYYIVKIKNYLRNQKLNRINK